MVTMKMTRFHNYSVMMDMKNQPLARAHELIKQLTVDSVRLRRLTQVAVLSIDAVSTSIYASEVSLSKATDSYQLHWI